MASRKHDLHVIWITWGIGFSMVRGNFIENSRAEVAAGDLSGKSMTCEAEGKRTARYRKRQKTSATEREILEKYAELYVEQRERDSRRTESRRIVAMARDELRAISGRRWDDCDGDPYEVRQWFNRWAKRDRRQRVLGNRVARPLSAIEGADESADAIDETRGPPTLHVLLGDDFSDGCELCYCE
jgi:hypothetical protein